MECIREQNNTNPIDGEGVDIHSSEIERRTRQQQQRQRCTKNEYYRLQLSKLKHDEERKGRNMEWDKFTEKESPIRWGN